MIQYWVAVASREHVLKGVSEGVAQVCHGKKGPLGRMKAGDWLVYYSPTEQFRGDIPCRRFTAIGKVSPQEPYLYEMSPDFIPWRRDVSFQAASEASILPLLGLLSFTRGIRSWGLPFRRGCFKIPQEDFTVISSSMGIILPE